MSSPSSPPRSTRCSTASRPASATSRRFSAEVSHELRTPLASVIAEAQLALRHPRSREKHRAGYERVLASAQQMTRTLDTLVAATRVELARPARHRRRRASGSCGRSVAAPRSPRPTGSGSRSRSPRTDQDRRRRRGRRARARPADRERMPVRLELGRGRDRAHATAPSCSASATTARASRTRIASGSSSRAGAATTATATNAGGRRTRAARSPAGSREPPAETCTPWATAAEAISPRGYRPAKPSLMPPPAACGRSFPARALDR